LRWIARHWGGRGVCGQAKADVGSDLLFSQELKEKISKAVFGKKSELKWGFGCLGADVWVGGEM